MSILKSTVITIIILSCNLCIAKNSLTYEQEVKLIDELRLEKIINQKDYKYLKEKTERRKPLLKGKTLGGTSVINGHIQDTSAVAIANQTVYLFEIVGGQRTAALASQQTDMAGNYSFTTLNAGIYIVYVGEASDNYLNYLWNSTSNDVCTIATCEITMNNHINLSAASTINGIDFVMEIGGTVTGSVTDSVTNMPVTTLSVFMINTDFTINYHLATNFDQTTGNFTISGIPDGNYKIYLEFTDFFNSSNSHIPQIFGGPECNYCRRLLSPSTGTVLTITSASTINNVDFSLNVGASISGNLVDNNTLNPLTNYGFIFVFDDANSFLGYQVVPGTSDDPMADGSYTLGGLLPGNYYVQGGDAGNDFYQRELYSNRPCYYASCDRSLGDLVALAPLENKIGINFLLEKGGRISGTVIDAITGLPLVLDDDNQAPYVEFFDASEQVKGAGFVRQDGTYIAGRAMPAGNYSVRTGSMFSGNLNQPYLNEKYNDIPCAGLSCDLSTPNITLVNDATVPNIDFALTKGHSFTGTVTDLSTSAPLSGVNILVYKDMGMGTVKFANWAITGDGSPGSLPVGEFIVTGLDNGTYYARTGYGSDLPFFISSFINIGGAAPTGWIDILYDGLPCLTGCDVTTGTPIVLPTVVNKSNSGTPVGPVVNFGLLQGAVITGKVTDFIQNGPLAGINIKVYNAQGTFMGSSITDAQGNYITRGLPAGTYYLITSSLNGLLDVKYGNELCYPSTCNPLDAQPITITEFETKPNQNFILKTAFMHMFSDDFE